MKYDLLIYNGKVITPDAIINEGILIINKGKIVEIKDSAVDLPALLLESAVAIDANGNYISPGFIDIHVHGGGGQDFMDNSYTGFLEIAKMHARHGTTAMTPTTLSCEKQDLIETILLYEQCAQIDQEGAQFIGLHIEGPYFAMNQKGAQPARYIRNPQQAEYREIISSTRCIKRWSAAPELDGALAFGKFLLKNNILPSIAHTDAIYEEVLAAQKAGYSHVTHLYCAMSGVTRKNAYRYAGVIESALLLDDLTVEIIADGKHLPPALLKLVYKVKGPDNIALITDAMRGAGMGEGKSMLGGLQNGIEVTIEDGVAKLPDRSAFAGSVATADLLVRNMVNLAEVPLLDAVKMMTRTPARIMKIADRKGSLIKGLDADITIFDDDIQIFYTIVAGKVIYTKSNNLNS